MKEKRERKETSMMVGVFSFFDVRLGFFRLLFSGSLLLFCSRACGC